ncbi:MAG: class I adenylate-forming enzyme family protein [Marinagarivorans sp.]
MRTLFSRFSQAAERFGDAPYLKNDSQPLSYQQAHHRVCGLAGQLAEAGVKSWDRVLLVSPNHIQVPLAVLAINALGAIAVVVNEQTTQASLAAILAETQPTLVFGHSSQAERWAEQTRQPVWFIDQLELAAAPSAPAPRQPPCSQDPALMIYTSGSTGKPKGVVLSQDNVLFASEQIQARLGYRPDDTIGLFLPLSFDYGLYQMFLAFLAGACLYVSDASKAGPALAGTLQQQGVTVFPGVPHLYNLLTQFLIRKQMQLTGIRLCTNTGAHLPQAQIELLRERLPNSQVAPMYGLTECKRVAILRPEEVASKPGSVGRPLDDTSAYIVDDAGNLLPPGEVGELVIVGRHVGLGYWQAPEETALRYRVHPCGIGRALYSGDNFRQDAEGYLYYVGRRDEQIKRQGFRINRLEIEDTALRLPGVINACLIQADSRLVLFVGFMQAEKVIGEREILTFLARELEPYKVPDAVEVLEDFPVSSNGKINRKAIEAAYS